jgi:hypothetical protein
LDRKKHGTEESHRDGTDEKISKTMVMNHSSMPARTHILKTPSTSSVSGCPNAGKKDPKADRRAAMGYEKIQAML